MPTATMKPRASISGTSAETSLSAKPGYKHTKLGWIPEEWEVAPLGKLSERIMVGIASAATHAYRAKGVLLLRNQNILDGVIDESDVLYIDEGYEQLHKNKRLKAGDVVSMRTGYPGVSAVVPKHLEGSQCFTSLITRLNSRRLSSKYLVYYMNSPIGRKIIGATEIGGAQKNVNAGSLERLPVITPPLPEQRRIAAVLGAWDRAIATTQQLLAAQQKRKRGLIGTALGEIYHHRRKVNIGDIAEEVSERNTDAAEHIVLSCSKHKGFVSSLEYFKKQMFSEDRSNYKVIRRGQFGFPANHIEEGSIDLLRAHEVGLVSPIYVVFEFDHAKANSEFMYYLFKSDRYRHIFRTSTNASVDRRGSLRWNDFKNLWVPLPDRDEQDRLARVFAGLDKQIEQTTNYLEYLNTQKRGLMQQLLTGQTRVKA
ncbi:MAG: restriction endonuclease subunit S [Flavobacteriales bacterium]|nr:restriction endonuclease subunit S [Flavobacteriales bacterium]